MLSTACWGSTPANRSGVRIDKGEPAPYAGYLFNEKTTRDIAEGWHRSEEQLKVMTRAYNDLKKESLESVQELKFEILELNAAMEQDAKKARKARRKKNFWSATTFLLVGGALGAVIHNNR